MSKTPLLLAMLLLSACRSEGEKPPAPAASAAASQPAVPPPSSVPSSAPKAAGLTFAQWPETVLGFPVESDLKTFQDTCTKAGGTIIGGEKHECSKTAADIGVPGHVIRVKCKDGTSLCSYFLFPDDKGGDAFRSFRRKLIGKYGEPTSAGNRTMMVDAIDSECKVLKEKFTHTDRWSFRDGEREREIVIMGSCEPGGEGLGKFSWNALYFLERGSAESDDEHAEARKNF